MTLIYSNFSSQAGLFAMSDVLLSRPAHLVTRPLKLPLRREERIYVSNDGKYAAAGLGQKTVVFDRTMVQWAGNSLFAKRLIDEIFVRSEHGKNRLELTAIANEYSGLNESQLSEVSLIYHYRGDNLALFRDQIDCSKGFALGGELFVAGSGEQDLINNTVITGPDSLVQPAQFISDALMRGVSHIAVETGSVDRYGLSYGGWIEHAWAETSTFRKLPYAAKYWAIMENGDLFWHDPLVFSFYAGHDLGICRMFFEGPNFSPETSFWRVPDLLRRPPTFARPSEVPFEPVFTVHQIFDRRTKEVGMIIRGPNEPSGISLRMVDGNVSLTYEAELLESVRAFKTTETEWTMGPNPAFTS